MNGSENERIVMRTDLKMYTLFGKEFLVLTIPYGLVDDGSWCKTNSGSNIHFIDLESQRLDFTIYSADYLLDVETENRIP